VAPEATLSALTIPYDAYQSNSAVFTNALDYKMNENDVYVLAGYPYEVKYEFISKYLRFDQTCQNSEWSKKKDHTPSIIFQTIHNCILSQPQRLL
tara:strand:- start:229 stop:513 length:285 start_codon:yes stop_codon:yes gene_type:complete